MEENFHEKVESIRSKIKHSKTSAINWGIELTEEKSANKPPDKTSKSKSKFLKEMKIEAKNHSTNKTNALNSKFIAAKDIHESDLLLSKKRKLMKNTGDEFVFPEHLTTNPPEAAVTYYKKMVEHANKVTSKGIENVKIDKKILKKY